LVASVSDTPQCVIQTKIANIRQKSDAPNNIMLMTNSRFCNETDVGLMPDSPSVSFVSPIVMGSVSSSFNCSYCGLEDLSFSIVHNRRVVMTGKVLDSSNLVGSDLNDEEIESSWILARLLIRATKIIIEFYCGWSWLSFNWIIGRRQGQYLDLGLNRLDSAPSNSESSRADTAGTPEALI
jgi:hypothetical protein